MFQLGRHGPVKGGKITPVRSSSALVLSSTNSNREKHLRAAAADRGERLLEPGLRAALSAHRAQDRDQDLHRLPPVGRQRQQRDHGADCCCTAPASSISSASTPGSARRSTSKAVQVTEWDEPQAVIGSYLHRYAYPDWYAAHLEARPRAAGGARPRARRAARLPAAARRISVRRRRAGRHARLRRRVIANKGVSQRIITAPFSPLGQDTHIATQERDLRRAADQPADRAGQEPGRADAR